MFYLHVKVVYFPILYVVLCVQLMTSLMSPVSNRLLPFLFNILPFTFVPYRSVLKELMCVFLVTLHPFWYRFEISKAYFG